MGKISWILPWGGREREKKGRGRGRLVCVWHGEVQFKNPCCSCMLLHENITKTSVGLLLVSAARSQRSATIADGETDSALCGFLPLITPPPYSPATSSVLASWLTPLARLSSLAAFTETAPKRKPGYGRTWRRACANLCLCDFGWHKSFQRCPFVKESNYFGTFQPPHYHTWCVSLSKKFLLTLSVQNTHL